MDLHCGHLETHLWSVHPETLKKIQDEIKSTWLSRYFIFDEECGKTVCIINDCCVNIFRGISYLKEHLFKEHNIVEYNNNRSTNIISHRIGTHLQATKHSEVSWSPNKSIAWQYFTLEDWQFAKCNICNKSYHRKMLCNLEKHLSHLHPEIPKKLQEEVRCSWLSQYFIFEKGHRIRCTYNCHPFSIFRGINYLRDHLFNFHNIDKSNAWINSNGQQDEAYSQVAKYLKRSWSFRNTVAWQYFTSENWPFTKCNICNKRYNGKRLQHLEEHLFLKHPKTVEKIKNEIRCSWMSKYFTFDKRDRMDFAKCIYNCKPFCIFRGINYLRSHLSKNHNIDEFNDSDSTYFNGQQADAHAQAAKHHKGSWSFRYTTVWQYMTSEEWPFSKCNICNKRLSSGIIPNLEKHLACQHPETVKKMQDEIRCSWLSQYFKVYVKGHMTRCIYNCNRMSIYRGLDYFKDHLAKKHNIDETNATVKSDYTQTHISKIVENEEK
ncbi:uncharacterized protein LOC105197172 isoform X2 [Solenopsis invicta]|uniref:uncharacterized protein LOC105197172 isoform X2 n=1 Tax=Solenopsis invicta TaxID=13686 RepID=UPI000595A24B|nr:uncharacterized protein LOC105197172 isoform X2 [Solenopsis invicta]